MKSRRIAGAVTIVCALALLIVPAIASASVASRSGNAVTITGGAESNVISLTSECCYYNARISDAAGITAEGECTQDSPTAVTCGTSQDELDVSVTLGDGNDSFTAPSGALRVNVDGGAGDDTIVGTGGDDVIRGGEGNDDLEGSHGNDQVSGDAGDDIVGGGTAADTVIGGPGRDRIAGDGSGFYSNGGSDVIDSRDGEADTVSCGLGADTVTADSLDVIDGECEGVDKGSTPEPPPNGGGSEGLSVAMTPPRSVKLATFLGRSGFKFNVAFSADCQAAIRITVGGADSRRLKLGRGATTLAKIASPVTAGAFEVTLKPTSRFRTKLRRLRRVPATILLSCNDGSTVARASKRVTFSR